MNRAASFSALVVLLSLVAGASLLVADTAFVPSVGAWAGEAPPDPLVFAGSGSNLAPIRLLTQAFGRVRPEIRIDVPASIGSTGGIRAAAGGGRLPSA
ncbi:MAG: hypothetical protein HY725_17875 [Candidatus Rokubacteria bacterium]|nr:hypothetical protein [Candidatus Rokubacteria bacterium]